MHASHVSSAGASAYQPVYSQRKTRGSDEAAPAQAAERRGENHRHHRSERAERSEDSRPIRNPSNPLVNAMMEALKGLTQGAGKATDSASTEAPTKDVPTAEATSGDAPKSVKEAALDFANELYSALRAAGESTGAAAQKKTGYGASSGGYGDLAQGLKRLAQRLTTPAQADGAAPAATTTPSPVSADAPKPVSAPASAPVSAPATAPAPTAAPVVSQPVEAAPAPKPVSANPETPKPSAPAPATASSASSPITINITFNFVNSTAIGASKASTTTAPDDSKGAKSTEAQADSPLLKAFKDLMSALKGDSKGGAAIDNDKAIQMLQGFLQKIAESLGGDAAAQTPEASLPAKGSLISVTA